MACIFEKVLQQRRQAGIFCLRQISCSLDYCLVARDELLILLLLYSGLLKLAICYTYRIMISVQHILISQSSLRLSKQELLTTQL